jgi:hypothetical protein
MHVVLIDACMSHHACCRLHAVSEVIKNMPTAAAWAFECMPPLEDKVKERHEGTGARSIWTVSCVR